MHKPRTTEQLYELITAILLTRKRLITDHDAYHHYSGKSKTWLIIGCPNEDTAVFNLSLSNKKLWIPKYVGTNLT